MALAGTPRVVGAADVQNGPIWSLLPEWVKTLPGIEVLAALLVLVVGWYAAKLTVRLLARPVARQFTRPSVSQIVLRMVRLSVLLVTVAVAASQLGLDPGNILLSVTVFSAVVGIVLAPIVGSIINGLFVLADRPYEIGDMIELVDEETMGYVEDITLRYTKLFTLDNTFIVVPNSTMRERDVVNYSAEDERTRSSLNVIVTYEGDLDAARRIMEQAARKVDGVITGGPDIRIGSTRYPAAPTCYIDTYGDDGVHLALRYWTEKPYRLLAVRSAIQERIWTALESADVRIAYPHTHLVFDDTSGEARVSMRDSGGGRNVDGDGPATDREE